jgi:RNA polymerase sigma factor (sigma-70 family)
MTRPRHRARPGGSRAPGSLPPLSRLEEQRLWRQWRAHGDAQARERLAAASLHLVTQLARDQLHRGLTYDQLFSAGSEGLALALERFDAARRVRLASYARWWIRERIEAAIERVPLASGIGIRDRMVQHAGCVRRLEQERGRTVSSDEAWRALGWRHDPEQRLQRATAAASAVHLDDPANDHDPTPLGNTLATPGPDPEQQMEQRELVAALAELVGRLPDRERQVVRLYFGLDGTSGGRDLRAVGNELGCTMQRSHQLLGRALDQLRQWAMAPDGPGARLEELR